ncbi:DUF5309 family protein [Micromonospora sp. STR1s_5]|nr:DUF5309 family protein [Micromonospora sp. STR1s_5]
MAKVTNAFTTYNSATNREDLADVIYNISPSDTPLMTLAGRRNASNRTFDWSTEALPAVNASNADQEGYVLTNASTSAPARQTNVAQISHRDATVSRSQQGGNMAGVGKGKQTGSLDGSRLEGPQARHGNHPLLGSGPRRW